MMSYKLLIATYHFTRVHFQNFLIVMEDEILEYIKIVTKNPDNTIIDKLLTLTYDPNNIPIFENLIDFCENDFNHIGYCFLLIKECFSRRLLSFNESDLLNHIDLIFQKLLNFPKIQNDFCVGMISSSISVMLTAFDDIGTVISKIMMFYKCEITHNLSFSIMYSYSNYFSSNHELSSKKKFKEAIFQNFVEISFEEIRNRSYNGILLLLKCFNIYIGDISILKQDFNILEKYAKGCSKDNKLLPVLECILSFEHDSNILMILTHIVTKSRSRALLELLLNHIISSEIKDMSALSLFIFKFTENYSLIGNLNNFDNLLLYILKISDFYFEHSDIVSSLNIVRLFGYISRFDSESQRHVLLTFFKKYIKFLSDCTSEMISEILNSISLNDIYESNEDLFRYCDLSCMSVFVDSFKVLLDHFHQGSFNYVLLGLYLIFSAIIIRDQKNNSNKEALSFVGRIFSICFVLLKLVPVSKDALGLFFENCSIFFSRLYIETFISVKISLKIHKFSQVIQYDDLIKHEDGNKSVIDHFRMFKRVMRRPIMNIINFSSNISLLESIIQHFFIDFILKEPKLIDYIKKIPKTNSLLQRKIFPDLSGYNLRDFGFIIKKVNYIIASLIDEKNIYDYLTFFDCGLKSLQYYQYNDIFRFFREISGLVSYMKDKNKINQHSVAVWVTKEEGLILSLIKNFDNRSFDCFSSIVSFLSILVELFSNSVKEYVEFYAFFHITLKVVLFISKLFELSFEVAYLLIKIPCKTILYPYLNYGAMLYFEDNGYIEMINIFFQALSFLVMTKVKLKEEKYLDFVKCLKNILIFNISIIINNIMLVRNHLFLCLLYYSSDKIWSEVASLISLIFTSPNLSQANVYDELNYFSSICVIVIDGLINIKFSHNTFTKISKSLFDIKNHNNNHFEDVINKIINCYDQSTQPILCELFHKCFRNINTENIEFFCYNMKKYRIYLSDHSEFRPLFAW